MSGFDALISHLDQFARQETGAKPMNTQRTMTNTFDIVGVAQRETSRQHRKQLGKVAAGLALMIFGFSKPSITRVLLGVFGGALVFRGLTDQSLFSSARSKFKSLRTPKGRADDLIDERSEQSFPASDPPSFSASHS